LDQTAGYSDQIVALTAHLMKGEIDECLAAGCDAFLSKPIDPKTFISEVSARMGVQSTSKDRSAERTTN
jgi:CheY-like chemotaxis protein